MTPVPSPSMIFPHIVVIEPCFGTSTVIIDWGYSAAPSQSSCLLVVNVSRWLFELALGAQGAVRRLVPRVPHKAFVSLQHPDSRSGKRWRRGVGDLSSGTVPELL